LTRLGFVRQVQMNHRHRHYAPAGNDHGHHLVCNGCGRVVEFSDCQVERLARTLARRTRFVIEGHSVELYGRCPDCRLARRTPWSDRSHDTPQVHRKQEARCV
jgi:Fe2+ or Zn2+ uptake regulation protein